MNRGDIFAYKGVARAGYVAIVSNDGFNAITGHPVVVKVSDRPDLTETPYVVALSRDDPVPGHLESYSAVRVRRNRLSGDPVVQQTVLIDAPAVLGWQRWREIDEQNLGWIKAALTYAADTGRIERRHVDVFAHIVLAAANEVALKVARADDPAATLPAAESAFAEFLDRLLGEPGSARLTIAGSE